MASRDKSKPGNKPKSQNVVDLAGARDKTKTQLREELAAAGKLPANAQQPIPETIEALNRKHAVVQYGGDVRIMTEVVDPTTNRRSLAFSTQADFKLRYCNQVVEVGTDGEGKPKYKDLGAWWIKHPQRRQYEGIVFDPRGTPEGYYNLWQGFAIEPAAGDCTALRTVRYKQHLLEVICSGDAAKYRFMWLWLAHLVQRPWELPEVAIVMRSKPGSGKDSLMEPVQRIFGRHYAPLTSSHLLVGRFTAHLAEAIVVYANESIWGGDKTSEGKLKAMITDSLEPIEPKGKDTRFLPNYKRVVAASNEDWAVPRGIADRRFFCLDVSNHRLGDTAYFEALREEIDNGGAEGLLAELLAVELDGWHPRHNMPKVRDGEDIKIKSLNPSLGFLFECLSMGSNILRPELDNEAGMRGYGWHTTIPKQILRDQYFAWCKVNRKHPEDANLFTKQLKEAVKLSLTRPRTGHDRITAYVFPELEEARRQFQEHVADVPFEDETEDECF